MTPATLTLTAAAVLLLAASSSARASIEAGQGGASFDLGNFSWYYALLAGVGMHAILYKFVHDYRLWCEMKAYRKQLQYYADDRSLKFAGYIAAKYGLNISVGNAYELLTKD